MNIHKLRHATTRILQKTTINKYDTIYKCIQNPKWNNKIQHIYTQQYKIQKQKYINKNAHKYLWKCKGYTNKQKSKKYIYTQNIYIYNNNKYIYTQYNKYIHTKYVYTINFKGLRPSTDAKASRL